jgi:2-polyprenyl-3-methyl-5-hydroxy-6-metoxy-1,4-benzoquinol methylase
MSRYRYLRKTLAKYASLQSASCPYCLSGKTSLVQWKMGLWQLRECSNCLLRFRFPKDEVEENHSFYQAQYEQENVTDLPREEDLPFHISQCFGSVGRDLTTHLKTMQPIVSSGFVLDYGCSWGYGVYQLARAGYEAVGFEISRPRVEYGRRTLGLNLTSDIGELQVAGFDAIYSAHVLEHIPTPKVALTSFQKLLKPGGKLFLYVPNCQGEQAKRLGTRWGQMINEKHVLALTAEFFEKNLPHHGFSTEFSSSPYENPPRSFGGDWDWRGEELLVIATLQS